MKGRMAGKAMLTAKQKTLPKQLQEKIIKSKMKKKRRKNNEDIRRRQKLYENT